MRITVVWCGKQFRSGSSTQCRERFPRCRRPIVETLIDSIPVAVALSQLSPLTPGVYNPEHAVDKATTSSSFVHINTWTTMEKATDAMPLTGIDWASCLRAIPFDWSTLTSYWQDLVSWVEFYKILTIPLVLHLLSIAIPLNFVYIERGLTLLPWFWPIFKYQRHLATMQRLSFNLVTCASTVLCFMMRIGISYS